MANGARVGPGGETPVARVTFANRAALASTMADPWLRFGDAYSDGLVAIDGDLVRLLESVYHSRDRKSTRLNSSHSQISYAVFCLKKKKNIIKHTIIHIRLH